MHQMIIKHSHEVLLLVVLHDGPEQLQWVPMVKPGTPSNLSIPRISLIIRPALPKPLALVASFSIVHVNHAAVEAVHEQGVRLVCREQPRSSADSKSDKLCGHHVLI